MDLSCCSCPGKGTVGNVVSLSLGSNALVGIPLSSAPHTFPLLGSAALTTMAFFQRSSRQWEKERAARGFFCPATRHPPPRCFVPAESSRLPGSASVGNFPGHLYSRLCVNCFISSFSIHLRTGDRVTLPHNFTSVPIGGGGAARGQRNRLRPPKTGTVVTTRRMLGMRSYIPKPGPHCPASFFHSCT